MLIYGEKLPADDKAKAAEEEKKKKIRYLSAVVIVLTALLIVAVKVLQIGGIINLYLWDQMNSKIKVSTEIEEYHNYFGETGFDDGFSLAAMYADSTYGFVYALDDGHGRIVYVELIFCNYFYDLEYGQYIPWQYLPTGFGTGKENAYRKRMLGEEI